MSPEPDDTDNWEPIGIIAQRMAMAWDHVEAEDEAKALVRYSTDRQRAYIHRALWDEGTDKWQAWATGWLLKRWTKPEGEGREDV